MLPVNTGICSIFSFFFFLVIPGRFIDLKNGEVEKEPQDLLEKLTMTKIPISLPEKQIVDNTLKWNPIGIDPEDDIHGRYLEMLAEWFKTLIIQQIDKCIELGWDKQIRNHVILETLSHLRPCAVLRDYFFGQDELLNQIHNAMHAVKNVKSVNDKEENVIIEESENKNSNDLTGAEVENRDENEEIGEVKEKQSEEDKGEKDAEKEEENESKNKNCEEKKENEKEEEEKVDKNEKDEQEKEEEEDNLSQVVEKINELSAFYKAMGDKAPTFGRGDVGYNKSSDPAINIKDDLIKFNMTDEYKHPVVIYGESGSGKSCLMARLAYLIKVWEPKAVVVIRFLGTTVTSLTIRSLIISICETIWSAYKMPIPTDLDLTSDIIYLGQYLQSLLWKLSTEERPLYLLLDSLDQLMAIEQAHSLTWLPSVLPPHGSVILSTLPDAFSILESARRIVPSSENFIEVPQFTEAAAQRVISSILNSKSRSITRPQRDFLIGKAYKFYYGDFFPIRIITI